MDVVDDLLRVFASSIFAKAGALKSQRLTPNQRKRLKASITADVRHSGGLLYPEVFTPEVSEAALLEAQKLSVDLCSHTWGSQKRFDPGRKLFHWEHVDPIGCIQQACESAESEVAVLTILKSRLRIAWILKQEDRELTRLGFRSNRLDPAGAYSAARIVLVKSKSGKSREQ